MSNLSENCISQHQSASGVCSQSSQFISSLRKLDALLGLWLQRHRQRKQLALLEPHMLNDLGLTREQVEQEVSKPFWR